MRVKRAPGPIGSPSGPLIPLTFSSTHREQPPSPWESAPINISYITIAQKVALKQKEEDKPKGADRSSDQQSLFALDAYDQVPSKPLNTLHLTNNPHAQQAIFSRSWCPPGATAEELRAMLSRPVRNMRGEAKSAPFDPNVQAVPFKTVKAAYARRKRVRDEEIADDLRAIAAAIQRSDSIAEATAESSSASSISPSSSGRWGIVEDTPATQAMEWSTSVSPHRGEQDGREEEQEQEQQVAEAEEEKRNEDRDCKGKGKRKEKAENLPVLGEPAAISLPPSSSSSSCSKQKQQHQKKRKTYDEDEMVRREQAGLPSKRVRRPRQRFQLEQPPARDPAPPQNREPRSETRPLGPNIGTSAHPTPTSTAPSSAPVPRPTQQRPPHTALPLLPASLLPRATPPLFPSQIRSESASRSGSPRKERKRRRSTPQPPAPPPTPNPTLRDALQSAGLTDRALMLAAPLESNVRGAAEVDFRELGLGMGREKLKMREGEREGGWRLRLFLQEARQRYVMEGRERVMAEWLVEEMGGRGRGGMGGGGGGGVGVRGEMGGEASAEDVEAAVALGMLKRGADG